LEQATHTFSRTGSRQKGEGRRTAAGRSRGRGGRCRPPRRSWTAAHGLVVSHPAKNPEP
jgi:hypothetical protein